MAYALLDLNANEIRLTCGSGGADNPANANWYTVFEDANRREREGKMKASEYIEMVVQNYTNAFWYTKKNSRDKFLKSTYAPGYGLRYLYDEYETPSNEKLNQYIRNMRNDLNAWIAPFYEKQLEKEYQTYLNNVYTYYSKLEKLMNSTIYISVVDPRCKDFSDSEFYGSAIGLSKTPDEKPCFVSEFLYQYGEKSNKGEDEFFVSFTVASWMKYGCPSYLRVVDFATKSEDFVSPIKLTLNPNKICTVELKSEGEVREEEILGTWNIQSEFADMDSPFVRMIVKFFDGIFGEGSGDDIVESDLDNKKMTQTLVIEKKGNTLYATLTSDGDVSQYTGTFRKGTLKLTYVKGSSDEEALSFGLEALEYKFVRVGAKVVMEGSYKINNYFLKANYKYKGTKIK